MQDAAPRGAADLVLGLSNLEGEAPNDGRVNLAEFNILAANFLN